MVVALSSILYSITKLSGGLMIIDNKMLIRAPREDNKAHIPRSLTSDEYDCGIEDMSNRKQVLHN